MVLEGNKNLDYNFLPQASYIGSVTQGSFYQSLVFPQMNFTSLNVNFKVNKIAKFQVFSMPTEDTANAIKVFEKDLVANQNYFKRFAIYGMYGFIKIINSHNTDDMELQLSTSLSSSAQFASQTLLNSTIGVDADTSLIRVANDWNCDMVRELHSEFQKVNIQGILNLASPSAAQTIGLGTYKFDAMGIGATDLYLTNSSSNDVSGGTGARSVRVEYLDANKDLATLDFNLPATATTTSLGVSAFMVHRVYTTSFGTNRENDGLIEIKNNGGTITFARIEVNENTSHSGCYLTARNRELIISTIDINASGQEGIIRVNEYDYNQGVRYSIGDFKIDSQKQAYSYNVNGKIDAFFGIVVDFIPTSGSPTLNTFINVMCNGVLCPIKDSFPEITS